MRKLFIFVLVVAAVLGGCKDVEKQISSAVSEEAAVERSVTSVDVVAEEEYSAIFPAPIGILAEGMAIKNGREELPAVFGDFTGDGALDGQDLEYLRSVLSGFAPAAPNHLSYIEVPQWGERVDWNGINHYVVGGEEGFIKKYDQCLFSGRFSPCLLGKEIQWLTFTCWSWIPLLSENNESVENGIVRVRLRIGSEEFEPQKLTEYSVEFGHILIPDEEFELIGDIRRMGEYDGIVFRLSIEERGDVRIYGSAEGEAVILNLHNQFPVVGPMIEMVDQME